MRQRYKFNRLRRNASYISIEDLDKKLEKLIEQLSFEETMGFLQQELVKSFSIDEDRMQMEHDKAQYVAVIQEKVDCMIKENKFLRNKNFGISKL